MDFPRAGVQYGDINVPWLYKEYLDRGKEIRAEKNFFKIYKEKSKERTDGNVNFLIKEIKIKNMQKNNLLRIDLQEISQLKIKLLELELESSYSHSETKALKDKIFIYRKFPESVRYQKIFDDAKEIYSKDMDKRQEIEKEIKEKNTHLGVFIKKSFLDEKIFKLELEKALKEQDANLEEEEEALQEKIKKEIYPEDSEGLIKFLHTY